MKPRASDDEVCAAFAECVNMSAREIADWVHGTAELPHGLRLTGGVEGGVLVAGGALDLLRGEDRALPMRARARVELGW